MGSPSFGAEMETGQAWLTPENCASALQPDLDLSFLAFPTSDFFPAFWTLHTCHPFLFSITT